MTDLTKIVSGTDKTIAECLVEARADLAELERIEAEIEPVRGGYRSVPNDRERFPLYAGNGFGSGALELSKKRRAEGIAWLENGADDNDC